MTIADFDWDKVDLKKAAKQLRYEMLDLSDQIEKGFETADDIVAHHSLFEEVDQLMRMIDSKLYALQYEDVSELSTTDKSEIESALNRIREILTNMSKALAFDGSLGKLVLGKKHKIVDWMD